MPVSHYKMDTFDRKCIQAFLLPYRILHITEILLLVCRKLIRATVAGMVPSFSRED